MSCIKIFSLKDVCRGRLDLVNHRQAVWRAKVAIGQTSPCPGDRRLAAGAFRYGMDSNKSSLIAHACTSGAEENRFFFFAFRLVEYKLLLTLSYFSQHEPRRFKVTFHDFAIFYHLMTLYAMDVALGLGLAYVFLLLQCGFTVAELLRQADFAPILDVADSSSDLDATCRIFSCFCI